MWRCCSPLCSGHSEHWSFAAGHSWAPLSLAQFSQSCWSVSRNAGQGMRLWAHYQIPRKSLHILLVPVWPTKQKVIHGESTVWKKWKCKAGERQRHLSCKIFCWEADFVRLFKPWARSGVKNLCFTNAEWEAFWIPLGIQMPVAHCNRGVISVSLWLGSSCINCWDLHWIRMALF